VLFIVVPLFLAPLVERFQFFDLQPFMKDQDGLGKAATRTLFFGVLSSLFNVVTALLIAVGLARIKISSLKGKLMALLIIPVLLGDVSIAFVAKSFFDSSQVLHESALLKYLLLIGMQFWQFGTLYIYLFWLVLQNIPANRFEYAKAHALSKATIKKDVLLPACRDLSVFLFVFNFIISIGEVAKSQLVLRASRGTNTELVGQWLQRTYQSLSLQNLEVAASRVLQHSGGFILLALLVVVIGASIFSIFYGLLLRRRIVVPIPFSQRIDRDHTIGFWILIILVIAPILRQLLIYGVNFDGGESALMQPLLLALLAALISTVLSAFLGMIWRFSFRTILDKFNDRSTLFMVFIMLVQFIPTVLVMFAGYQWIMELELSGNMSIQFVWVSSHVLLSLPILSSFVVASHFRLDNKELIYSDVSSVSLSKVFHDSFVSRFYGDYVLTFIIGVSLIWNEFGVNSILSDFIPSFVSELKVSVSGKGADYSKAMGYFGVSSLIAVGSFLTWTLVQSLQPAER